MASDLVMTVDYGAPHMGLHIGNSYWPANINCMETRGQRIRSMRKALGLNQGALAKLVGADQSTVSDWENEKVGAEPSAEVLMKLVDALGGSAEYIMRGYDPRTWPFARIPLQRFLALEPGDRDYLEGYLAAELERISPSPTAEDVQVLNAARKGNVKPRGKSRLA